MKIENLEQFTTRETLIDGQPVTCATREWLLSMLDPELKKEILARPVVK